MPWIVWKNVYVQLLATCTVSALYVQVTSFRVRNDSGAATLTRSASDRPARSSRILIGVRGPESVPAPELAFPIVRATYYAVRSLALRHPLDTQIPIEPVTVGESVLCEQAIPPRIGEHSEEDTRRSADLNKSVFPREWTADKIIER